MTTFFSDRDYRMYLSLISENKDEAGVDFWAYCLMPNHVHFVVVPVHEGSLSTLFRSVHRQYARFINRRNKWSGHLWQERFHSFVMDETHLLAAVRYTELNPVRAGLCEAAKDWNWSSIHAHLANEDDDIVSVNPMNGLVSNWSSYISRPENEDTLREFRQNSSSGRPSGGSEFLDEIELVTGRNVRRKKPGPKPQIK